MPLNMPQVDLYYSSTLLGHFTLIVYDKTELIAYRVHFVDKDAETARGGSLSWAQHKVAQFSGFARGSVLMDWVASPKEFEQRLTYSKNNRFLVRSWPISVTAMDTMLNWAHSQVLNERNGHFGSYGYVVYGSNVDNCGSWAIKCLGQAGISIELPYLKSWAQLPSLIRQDI